MGARRIVLTRSSGRSACVRRERTADRRGPADSPEAGYRHVSCHPTPDCPCGQPNLLPLKTHPVQMERAFGRRPGCLRKGGRVATSLADPWQIAFAIADTQHDPPGQVFLRGVPRKVRSTLQAVLEAVADAPPPRFAGALHWQAMHGSMRGIYEVRVKGPDRRLYRLFCVLEREPPGMTGPTLVVLDGMSKANGTAFTEHEYRRIVRLRDEHVARDPRRVAL